MPDYFETIERLPEYEVWCNARGVDALAGLSEIELRRYFGQGPRVAPAPTPPACSDPVSARLRRM